MFYQVKEQATHETNYHDDQHATDARVEPDGQEDFEVARKAIKVAGLGRVTSGRDAQPGLPGAFLPLPAPTKAGQWKAEADDMIKKLSDAEVSAKSMEGEILAAIDSDTNPALQRNMQTWQAIGRIN